MDTSQAPLLSETQAAALMLVSPRTLQAWRARGRGPVFMRVGSRIRYCPHQLEGWLKRRCDSTTIPRKAKPVTLAQRPILPERTVGLIAREMARGFAGDVYMGEAAHRRLTQALGPHEATLARALCKEVQVRDDGTIRLVVPRNISFTDAHLPANKLTVGVEYDPRSGRWISDIAAGHGGFDGLCAHVWRVQGRRDGMAARDLLAFIGAAYLASLSERKAA